VPLARGSVSRVRTDEAKAAPQQNMGLKRYIPVTTKFWIAQVGAVFWVAMSVRLWLRWLEDLACAVGFPLALFLISFIAYVPGYLNTFLGISLLLDRQPPPKDKRATAGVLWFPRYFPQAAWGPTLGREVTSRRNVERIAENVSNACIDIGKIPLARAQSSCRLPTGRCLNISNGWGSYRRS